MIYQFSILISGFSIFSAFILIFSYLFFMPDMRKTLAGKIACTLLLLSFSGLQVAHSLYFSHGIELLETKIYTHTLLCIPAMFYFFSRAVVLPDFHFQWTDLLHLLPILAGLSMPNDLIPLLSFIIGIVYTFWMAHIVYQLREHSRRFKFEIFFFGLFVFIAILALLLGLLIPYIDNAIFYTLYANSIGLAMLLVVAALIIFPEITRDVVNIADAAYASSKLVRIDVEAKSRELEKLMREDKVFHNETLNLSSLAELLELSAHQLSELVNTQFNIGVPRYIREKRIEEACKLLKDEPNSSILSISMSTGFRSQSSFYTAFHEIVGESPGNYRKNL